MLMNPNFCRIGRLTRWLALLAFMMVPVGAFADSGAEKELVTCARGNLPGDTAVQLVEATTRDRVGATRKLEVKFHFKRTGAESSRFRGRIENPAELRGAAYLMIADAGSDTMYMFLPSARKARRVTGGMMNTRLWGTDFSYEDFQQIQGIALRGERSLLPDADVLGRPARVMDVVPEGEQESRYERLRWYFDAATCLPIQIEFFEPGDVLRKRLLAEPEDFGQEDGRWVARRVEMSDLADGTSSTLRIVEADYGVPIPDRVFQPNRLGRER